MANYQDPSASARKVSAILKMACISCIALFIYANTTAQSAYRGGKGDGYAMAQQDIIHIGADGKVSPVAYKNKIYPNPMLSGEALYLSFSTIPATLISLELMDLTGRAIFKGNMIISSNITALPFRDLAQGLYFIRITKPGNTDVIKLLVLRH